MVASFVHGKLYHQKKLPVLPTREKVKRVIDGMAGVFTMVIILGGIISGVFTATEAGAAASVYALILTVFVYREIKLGELPEILWECCLTNAVVMMLIATSSVFSWILSYENLPTMLAENFFNLIDSKWAFLLILNGFLLVVGMFIDMTPAIIMLVPMLLPLAAKFGIDFVHLGLIIVINLAYGLTTPPLRLAAAQLRPDEVASPRGCQTWGGPSTEKPERATGGRRRPGQSTRVGCEAVDSPARLTAAPVDRNPNRSGRGGALQWIS